MTDVNAQVLFEQMGKGKRKKGKVSIGRRHKDRRFLSAFLKYETACHNAFWDLEEAVLCDHADQEETLKLRERATPTAWIEARRGVVSTAHTRALGPRK